MSPQSQADCVRAQDSRDALDHHFAHVRGGLADQRDTPDRFACGFRQTERERPHPSGAGARLACAASAEEQPDAPVLLLDPEGELRWARVEFPRLKQLLEFALRDPFKNFVQRPVLFGVDQVFAQVQL
jgi:hypothetical protein